MSADEPAPDYPGLGRAFKLYRLGVAIDFSEEADRALEVAALIARDSGAAVDLIHVAHAPLLMPSAKALRGARGPSPAPPLEERRLAAEARLQGLARRVRQLAIVTEAEVVSSDGDYALAIVDAAMARHVDLLVMGSRGRRGVERWVMGSVAESVLRESPIPVLVVPSNHGSD